MGERARDNTILPYPACMHVCMYVCKLGPREKMIAYFSQEEDILGDRPNVTNFVNIEKVCFSLIMPSKFILVGEWLSLVLKVIGGL